MNYDCIVIGAGNAGLVSALTLQKQGKKVLVLESGKVPGGVATSFKRGVFEFEASLHELYGYGNATNKGEIFQLFERLGISSKVNMKELDESFHVIFKDSKEEYTMPTGIDNFIQKMEEYVPGSQDAMVTFFGLCEDIKDAFLYLGEQKESFDLNDFYQKYPNFVQVAPCSVKTVLEAIQMPRKAIQILSTYWITVGSPITDLSFLHYSMMIDSYIKYKPSIPFLTSHELSLILENEFRANGGTIKYFHKVNEIFVENNQVTGVQVGDTIYSSSHVIANLSPITVYGNMIKKESIPKEALKLNNKRTLGQKAISVYLGLNKTSSELGLTHYSYYIYNSFDSEKEMKNMDHILNGNLIATVINNGVKIASPEGTTILKLTGMFYGDEMDKNVTSENYFEFKEHIGEKFISYFEEATGIQIKEFIEEIEVATPVTYARYTGHPDGVMFGFQAKGYDNFLSRYAAYEEESFIKGLHFCGGFGSRLSGYSATYLNGEEVALKVSKEC